NLIGGVSAPADGALAGEGNVIADNGGDGVLVAGLAPMGNTVQGNYIGTDVTGRNPLGNTANGVEVNGAPGNFIGVNRAGLAPDNVIADNGGDGVRITRGAGGNTLRGNYIGTDVSGKKSLGNGSDSVEIDASPNNIIGSGVLGQADNLISGNDQDGIFIVGAAA